MLTTKNNQKGFTIVELLIVIVVIGILAALVINTFSGVQRKARNAERQTDLKAIASQLEACYNDTDTTNCTFAGAYQSGSYPQTITAGASGILKRLDPNAIKNPQGATDSMVYGAGAYSTTTYRYIPIDNVPSACATAGDICTSFTLGGAQENGSDIVITSLNN